MSYGLYDKTPNDLLATATSEPDAQVTLRVALLKMQKKMARFSMDLHDSALKFLHDTAYLGLGNAT